MQVLGALLLLIEAATSAPAPQYADIRIARDFVETFSSAVVENCRAVEAVSRETIAQRGMPGIFLHPNAQGEASVLFDGIDIPAQELPLFLLFHTGMREGIPWDGPIRPNGVRFRIRINGEEVFQEDLAGSEWRPHALDMRAWAGKAVSVAFTTDSIDGRTNHDWSVWGEPLLVSLDPAVNAFSEQTAGVAFALIESTAAQTITLSMGPANRTFTVGPGAAWLPMEYLRLAPVALASQAAATFKRLWVGRYPPLLTAEELTLNSPLIVTGEPFGAVLRLKNRGRGVFSGPARAHLTIMSQTDTPQVSFSEPSEQPLSALLPGASASLQWRGMKAPGMGDYVLGVVLTGEVPELLSNPAPVLFHVFPPEPQAYTGEVVIQPDGTRFAGILQQSAGLIRMKVVEDTARKVYIIPEVRRGDGFQRTGSIYPLAHGVIRRKGADGVWQTEGAMLRIQDGNIFPDHAEARGEILGQPVHITLTPNPVMGRVRIFCEFTATEDLELLSFYGPEILAGDRAYGADKDFALFGGLEYLERDEASSSDRDLAFPLNDRRVPAIRKIASPVMAVQGKDTLTALLWDPRQNWAPGQQYPAAWFQAPKPGSGVDQIHLSLFLPSVGGYLKENTFEAAVPYVMKPGDKVTLEAWLVLDSAENLAKEALVAGPHKGGLVLQAYKHYFELFGLPKPSPQPRDWAAERALCLKGYFESVWNEDPPGWSHCHGWPAGPNVGHAVPLLVLQRDNLPPDMHQEISRRVDRVVDRLIREEGPQQLWSNRACHIMLAELPYLKGHTATALRGFRDAALNQLNNQKEGLWRWYPAKPLPQYQALGKAGDQTLSQAAHPLGVILRAARLTGDRALAQKGLEALAQINAHEVPRGAQTWECPLYQPDILAAAQAIRVYTEAFRLTSDAKYLEQARYWAWTGLPFLYLWDMDGYPTMRYNVISVMGSTFFTHSWLGLPVVWCGLVYAYALQDLAEFDQSLDWRLIAQGITNSAMQQQYAEGPSAGTYPDSWNMVDNKPNPADINPENILVNELRLRGFSPEIRCKRFATPGGVVMLNSAADIILAEGMPESGALRLQLGSAPETAVYSTLAPVAAPASLTGAGNRFDDELALRQAPEGWYYAEDLHMLVVKSPMHEGRAESTLSWGTQ